MRHERAGNGGEERKKAEQGMFFFFLHLANSRKNRDIDFFSSPCKKNTLRVVNKRRTPTFSSTWFFKTCARAQDAIDGNLSKNISRRLRKALLVTSCRRFPGDRRHGRRYNFIAADRIGRRRCIRPYGCQSTPGAKVEVGRAERNDGERNTGEEE